MAKNHVIIKKLTSSINDPGKFVNPVYKGIAYEKLYNVLNDWVQLLNISKKKTK